MLAIRNIWLHLLFHLKLKGGFAWRLTYFLIYYACWIGLRWGHRHERALKILKVLGLSERTVEVTLPEALVLELDMFTAFKILYYLHQHRVYEPSPEYAVHHGDVVIDVGAQQGIYSCLAAQKAGPSGKVVAFEPHPANFRILIANKRRNRLTNILPLPYALSNQDGEVRLYEHPLHSTGHSLVFQQNRSGIRVRCLTLDRALEELSIRKVDLLKIDVEGAALAVLAGGRNTLSRYRPRLVIETEDENPESIANFLREFGYRPDVRSDYVYASVFAG